MSQGMWRNSKYTHDAGEEEKCYAEENRARSVLLRNNTFWPHSPDLVMKTSEEESFCFALTGAQGLKECSSVPLSVQFEHIHVCRISTSSFLTYIFELPSQHSIGFL